MAGSPVGYTFGEFKLDLRRGTLQRRGVDVPLRPKSFGVLRMLVERYGQLVTRDELMDALWSDVIVTDGALTQCLIDVRRALDDGAQRMVRTITRRGYLFDMSVAPVTEQAESPRELQGDGAPVPPARPVAVETDTAFDVTGGMPGEVEPTAQAWPRRFGLGITLSLLVAVGAVAISRQIASPPARTPSTAVAVSERRSTTVQLPHPKSIAVLPFVNMSSDPEQEYFADGIAEEILNELAHESQLRVIARTSSFAFKHDNNAGVAEIATRLNVAYVLEGSVRRDAKRVRVTAQLVNASDGAHVWSNTYDRELAHSLSVQSEIASKVADALEITLRPAGPSAGSAMATAANDAFLRGRYFYHRRANGDVARARASLEEAVRLDPRHARAWVRLAGIYGLLVDEGALSAEEAAELRRRALRTALEIDPMLPEAQVEAAWNAMATGNARAAVDHFLVAYRLDRDDSAVLGWLSMMYASLHRFDDWIAVDRRLVDRDPLSYMARVNHANYLMTTSHFEEARSEFHHAAALNPESEPGIAVDLVRLQLLERHYAAALRQAEALPSGDDRTQMLALAHEGLGDRVAADAHLARLRAASDAANALRVAEIHAARGERDTAFHWLHRAYDRLGDQPWTSADGQTLWQLGFSPFLVPLYDDARWAPLSARGTPPVVRETLALLPRELTRPSGS